MTGDISSLASLSSAAASLVKSGAMPNDLVKLLQPIQGLIPAGSSAPAQVVSQQPGDQAFQLLLRLNLSNGQQPLVQASSQQSYPAGTHLLVSQPTPGSLAITVQQSQSNAVASLLSIDTKQLPVGTLLQGTVLSSQALPNQGLPQGDGQPTTYRNVITLLNTLLAGTSLTVDSPQPLNVGTLLSAQVQGAQSLTFVQLSDRLDQLAIAQQLNTQQNRQGSLTGLLDLLQNLQSTTTQTNNSLPPDLRAAIDALLNGLPTTQQLTDPKSLALALAGSGAFLEAKLLGGQDPAAAPDLKANLLRLIAQTLPGVPGSSYDAAAAANTMARVMPSFIRSALGTLGLVSDKTQQSSFPLTARDLNMSKNDDLETLLKLAASAVSRLQSHQLSGLEQTRTAADGTQLTTWQLEIPMRNLQDIVPLQVKVQREESPDKDDADDKADGVTPAKEKLWRVDLAFDLEPLGPLQVQAQLVRGSLSSQLWAERPDSAALIARELEHLRTRLVEAGITVSELACHRGTPPQGQRTALEQRWIDETA